MDFKEYISKEYISLLIPKEFYNIIDINNQEELNFKKIRLSIIPISYDNITITKETNEYKKENYIPIIIETNNIIFKNVLNNVINDIKDIKLIIDNNINKIIYFIKVNDNYSYFINSIIIILPIFNKLCEIISKVYLRYPIINIYNNNEKLNIMFLKSRQLEDKDKYFYNCKYNKNDNLINQKIYYDNKDFETFFNKIN